jgi:sugar phosphate permease
MPTAPLNQSTSLSEDAVYAKIAWRLIPFLFLCYIAAYLDRVNVGFAKLQMQADLNFSDTVYGFAAGIFFIGYFLFEVPSNLLLERVGARLPQIIKNTGIKDPLQIGLLTTIPYGLAAISMVLFGRSSDRTRERRWHFAVAAFLSAIGLVISGVFGESTLSAMLGLSVATIGIISTFPLFWPMPTGILAGASAAAGIALINSIGNLAGFGAPFVIGWLTDLTKRPAYGLYVIAAILVLGGLLVLMFVPRRLPGDSV